MKLRVRPRIEADVISISLMALIGRVLDFLSRPAPWAGKRPFRFFVLVSSTAIAWIFGFKVLVDSQLRLQLYVVEVGVMFFLGFVVLEGARARRLASSSDYADVLGGGSALAALGLWNAGAWTIGTFRASSELGFGDAIVFILVSFVILYGRRGLRPMGAPISLLIALGGITVFISNEDPIFYQFVGRHFVELTVWITTGFLRAQGQTVVASADYFRVLGPTTLRVEVGIRCGGMDVAAIYALLIGYFAKGAPLRPTSRVVIAAGAAVGTLVLNGARVAVTTLLFLQFPGDLVEAMHTNLGDLVFLAYAAPFIVGLRRLRSDSVPGPTM